MTAEPATGGHADESPRAHNGLYILAVIVADGRGTARTLPETRPWDRAAFSVPWLPELPVDWGLRRWWRPADANGFVEPTDALCHYNLTGLGSHTNSPIIVDLESVPIVRTACGYFGCHIPMLGPLPTTRSSDPEGLHAAGNQPRGRRTRDPLGDITSPAPFQFVTARPIAFSLHMTLLRELPNPVLTVSTAPLPCMISSRGRGPVV